MNFVFATNTVSLLHPRSGYHCTSLNFADLVVLNRDPFVHPADEIGETKVLQTFVGGERVYSA